MNWMDTIWYNNIYSTMHNNAYLICLPSGFQMSATRSTRSACSCLVTAGCAHFSRSASSELFCSTPAANTKHKVRNIKIYIYKPFIIKRLYSRQCAANVKRKCCQNLCWKMLEKIMFSQSSCLIPAPFQPKPWNAHVCKRKAVALPSPGARSSSCVWKARAKSWHWSSQARRAEKCSKLSTDYLL